MKQRGILCHISSLPGRYGIGDLGPSAYRFADWLKEQKQSIWQMLPLSYCGYGNSPYNPISSFAKSPWLISPELLFEAALIDETELQNADIGFGHKVDFEAVYKAKEKLFEAVVPRYLSKRDIHPYIDKEASWIKPLMAFLCLAKVYGNTAWFGWDQQHREYSDDLYQELMSQYGDTMIQVAVLQEIADTQCTALKDYINDLGIKIFGDIPLYVSYESADVWANPQFFSVDNQGQRIMVAGVPPDAFSDEGQLWGNPVYNWDTLSEDGFAWFISRMGKSLEHFDLLRLDHFIGYVNYWQVPAECENAIKGSWIDAPATEFFDALFAQYPSKRFIAEDLGILTEKVCEVRDKYSLPGMIILQFCFDERVPNTLGFPPDKVIYTGTHDNQCSVGWFESYINTHPIAYRHLKEYMQVHDLLDFDSDLDAALVCKALIYSAYNSPCELAIIPIQDVLGLNDEHRMNIPGTPTGNWEFRIASWGSFDEVLFDIGDAKIEMTLHNKHV